MRIIRATFAAIGLATSLFAQGTNCTLLGTFNNHGPFNDVWGYTAPNGDEYALLCSTTGLVVVDITSPATPIERGWFPWASSTWRDCRTYGTYAYVVTEATSGFQIINLQNPNSPTLVGTFGTAYTNNAHNICIDEGAGRLYLVGTNAGTQVFDLLTNPANPSYVGQAYSSGNSSYYHDLCVENGYGYGAMIYNGDLRIFDVGTFPPTTLSNIQTPGNFTHNAWPNAAGTLCVTTDEISGGVVKFFDITNKSNPIALGQFTPNAITIPHNAFIVGNLCHVSWYSMGYRCIDISDPNNPVEVASYDTYPGTTNSYDGCWGCYPFLPSGNILASDRNTGLYIVRPNLTDLAVVHTPLGNTSNEDGPYTVLANITSSNPIATAEMKWRQGVSGPFTTVAMTPIGGDNFVGDIPGHDAVTQLQYYIEATDSVGSRRSPGTGENSFTVGTIQSAFADGFETDLGWTHGTTAVQDDWQRGAPAGASGTSGSHSWQDPSAAYAGSNCWGNDLGGPGWNGSYQNNNANWLQSPSIATNGVQGLHLYLQRWLQLAPADTGTIFVNGTPVWTVAGAINDSSWQAMDLDISAIADAATTLTVRFELNTNGSTVSGGWNIDEFQIAKISDSAPPLIYGAGTPGTGGLQPAISLSQPACLGQTAQIQGSSILANAGTFVAMNLAPDNVNTFGITALVQAAGAGILFAPADASGLVQFPFNVPNNPVFDNLYIFTQIIPLDAGAPGGLLSATPGLRFRVCLQ